MELAGHQCVGHCEIDRFAERSYRAMHSPKEDEWYASDITRIMPGELPEADIYCGGFPCQSFSIAGKRGGFDDTRGTLFFEVLRLAKERKPKLLFLENVVGLLNHDGGKTFATILNALGEVGYWYEYEVLNSRDFGIPQNRPRVFIIGHLGTYDGRTVFPITDSYQTACRFQNHHAHIGAITASQLPKSYIVEGEWLGKDPTHINGINHEVLKFMLSRSKIRELTPKECFRLQGYPDAYFERAQAVNSMSQLYKQAGNSVTVNVIREIARKIGEVTETDQ